MSIISLNPSSNLAKVGIIIPVSQGRETHDMDSNVQPVVAELAAAPRPVSALQALHVPAVERGTATRPHCIWVG